MSLANSINNLFKLEKNREHIINLNQLDYELNELRLYTNFLYKMELFNKFKVLTPVKELLNKIKNEKELVNMNLIIDINTKLKELNSKLKVIIHNLLRDKINFHNFIIELNIDKKIVANSKKLVKLFNEIERVLYNQLNSGNSIEDILEKLDEKIIVLNKNKIDINNLEGKNPILQFINMYFKNSSQGKNTTLSDVLKFIDKISDSDITDKIILKIDGT